MQRTIVDELGVSYVGHHVSGESSIKRLSAYLHQFYLLQPYSWGTNIQIR